MPICFAKTFNIPIPLSCKSRKLEGYSSPTQRYNSSNQPQMPHSFKIFSAYFWRFFQNYPCKWVRAVTKKISYSHALIFPPLSFCKGLFCVLFHPHPDNKNHCRTAMHCSHPTQPWWGCCKSHPIDESSDVLFSDYSGK